MLDFSSAKDYAYVDWEAKIDHSSDLPEVMDVTKKDIVRRIAEELGITQTQTREIVQRTFDAIIDTLTTEMKIELRNFGVFRIKVRKPRRAINPRTLESLRVPEKYVVRFKPGKELKKRLRALAKKHDLNRQG